jgi:hypothetical protein
MLENPVCEPIRKGWDGWPRLYRDGPCTSAFGETHSPQEMVWSIGTAHVQTQSSSMAMSFSSVICHPSRSVDILLEAVTSVCLADPRPWNDGGGIEGTGGKLVILTSTIIRLIVSLKWYVRVDRC